MKRQIFSWTSTTTGAAKDTREEQERGKAGKGGEGEGVGAGLRAPSGMEGSSLQN